VQTRLSGTYIFAGAAGEAGRALASAFQSAGARVVLVDRRRDEVEALGRALGVAAFAADLCDCGEARAVVAASESGGPVAGLIHLVGAFAKHAATEGGDELYDLMFDANVRTLFNCVRAVLPGMLERRAGFIAGFATDLVWGRGLGAGMSLYAAAKGAVAAYLAALERELRPAGIGVTTVFPLSSFDTPLNRRTTPEVAPETWLDLAEVAAALVFAASRGPRGRVPELPLVSAYSTR